MTSTSASLRGALVVVGELHLAHQVRVRRLEAVGSLERLREPHHALLAADAADLDRLRDGRHAISLATVPTRPAAASTARRRSAAADPPRTRSGRSARARPRRRACAPRAARARAARRRARCAATNDAPSGCSSSRARAEARGRPAVLRVVGAAAIAEPRLAAGSPPSSAVAHIACSSAANADESRTSVGWSGIAHLERPELRVRTHVPPDARVVLGDAERDEPLDPRLPLGVRRERRRRAGARQLGEHRRAVRRHAGQLAGEPGRVRREREHDRQPRQDRLEAAPALLRATASRHARAAPARPGAARRCRRSRRTSRSAAP